MEPAQIAPLVRADGVCEPPVGKRKYAFFTEGKAANALANAQKNRELQSSEHVENRYYECPRGAEHVRTLDGAEVPEKHYHLTHLSEEEWEGGHK